MRWEGEQQSTNVEDRRGAGGGFGLGGRSIGIGTVAIALVAGWIFGINPLTMLGLLSGDGAPQVQAPAEAPPPGDKAAAFVSTVLASTESVWTQSLQSVNGSGYIAPKLVLFRGTTPTACGRGQAAMGPFYCPLDQKIYIDLDFMDTLSNRLNAPGDFAQAYVIAHEVGHHLQTLLGVTEQANRLRAQGSREEANAISVRMELQADCLAGVWAKRSQQARNWLEAGDVEEALNAASSVGDDTLRSSTGRAVTPESFTHGTSAQRAGWFRRGFESGSMQQCDTFEAPQP